LTEAEFSFVIGTVPSERTGTRTAWRNGHRLRTITTMAGDLDLRTPKLRAGSFFPLAAGAPPPGGSVTVRGDHGAYLHRASARTVDDLVKALGADSGISKSEVSWICANLDSEVAAFRDRSLAGAAVPACVPIHH
jgi:transposase-like protein